MMTLLLLVSVINAAAFSLLFTRSIIAFGIFSLSVVFCMATLVGLMLTSWAGIITLLVYVGGLIVMFAYFLAICPNQLISLKDMLRRFSIMFLSSLLISYTFSALTPNWPASTIPITSIYSADNAQLLILIALILFLTLVAVVKVVQLKQGPLRPFNPKKQIKY